MPDPKSLKPTAGSLSADTGFAQPFARIAAYATVQLMERHQLLSDCGGKLSKKLMKAMGKPPKNSTSGEMQQTSSDAETALGTTVEVLILGRLGTTSSTTWSSTGLVPLSHPTSPGWQNRLLTARSVP